MNCRECSGTGIQQTVYTMDAERRCRRCRGTGQVYYSVTLPENRPEDLEYQKQYQDYWIWQRASQVPARRS